MQSISLGVAAALMLSVGALAAPEDSSEAAVSVTHLEDQLELMRSHNQDLLATVHWSLGVVAGVTLLLVGYSWFVNFKVSEREKSAISRALQAQQSAEMSAIESRLRRELEGTVSDGVGRAAKQHSDNVDAVQRKVSSLEQSVSEEIAMLKHDLAKRDLAEAQNGKRGGSILFAALNVLAASLGTQHYMKEYLASAALSECLRALASDDGFKIDADDLRRFEDVLADVPEGNEAVVEKIRTGLNERLP